MKSYDLIVIGAGTAATSTASRCAAAGWSVAVIDELPYGGTCALRGCDPKKMLRRGAELIDAVKLMRGKGVDAESLQINWADLMAFKRTFTDRMPDRVEGGLQRNGIETLHGTARMTGPNQVEVDSQLLESRFVLIATGARPKDLDITGSEHLIDSTQFLELEELPKRILFVGGGFISFEFAHIAARAGSDVCILDHRERPLPAFDPDLVDLLVDRTRRIGVEFCSQTDVQSITETDNSLEVSATQDGTEKTWNTDLVVHGAGRVAAVDRLDLKAADVEFSDRGIRVNEHLQSVSNSAVYAAGDASDTDGWYSNMRVGESSAAVKVLIDNGTDEILGAHLFGPEYAELVNIFGVAIKFGLKSNDLKRMVSAYPSVGSDLTSML